MGEYSIYILDGEQVEVPKGFDDKFLEKFPSATLLSSPDFQQSSSQRALLDQEEARLLEEGILVSDGEDTFSELQSIERGKEKIIPAPGYVGTFIDYKDFEKKIIRRPKQAIENLTEEQRIDYDAYRKLYKEALWEERVQDAAEISKQKSKTEADRIYNSVLGFSNQLGDFIPNTGISALGITNALFGVGEEQLITLTENQIIDQAERGQTGSLVKGIKEGNALELLGGTINAIGSLGASMIINSATGGIGIYTDFFGRGFTTINKARADKLGISMSELIESDQEDYLGSLVTSGLMGVMERFGLGAIDDAIANSTKAGFFQSLMYRLSAGTAEGITELGQTGMENVQVGIGQKKDSKGLGEDFINGMFSEEGLEAFLQGFIGGGLVTTAGAPKQEDVALAAGIVSLSTMGADGFLLAGGLTPVVAASAGRRLKGEAAKKREEELFAEMHELKNKLLKTNDPTNKKRIEDAIKNRKEELTNLTKQSNIIINQTSENDLKSIADVQLDFKKQNQELVNKYKNKEISQAEYNLQRKLITEEYKNNVKKLDDIVSDVSKKNQNISNENARLIKIIKTSENAAAVKKAKNDLVKNNIGFVEKLITSTFNPTLNTELTEADYRAAINLEFAKIINTYKIKENVPFGAYLQQNLPKRLPAIFDLAIETTPEGEMVAKTDVTQERNIIDDTDLNLEAATPETSSKILSKTGVSEQDINNKSKEILKSKLPGLDEKVSRDQNPFLTAIEKAAEGKFFETIYKKLGGNYNNKNKTEWESWLDKNIDDFLQLIEESGNKDYNRIKNKMLRGLYKGVKIGRAKKGEGGTNIGEGRYQYQTPTKQEAIDYFTKGGLTTLVERKKTLTKILAHATGKQGVANVISDPDVQKDFIEIQKLLGKEVPQNVKARIITALDRVIKKLESSKPDPNILRADFGLTAVIELSRRTFLNIAKKLKLYLEKDNFNTAKNKAIADAAKELNLSESQEKIFVTDAGVITLEDVVSGDAENIITAAIRATVKERFKEAANSQIKYIKEKLNDKNLDKKAKQDLVYNFFRYHNNVYGKNSKLHELWQKGKDGAEFSYNYWNKQFGGKLESLGFTLQGNKQKSIVFNGEKISTYVGRPSNHKTDQDPFAKYEPIVDQMDAQSELNKAFIINEVIRLLNSEGKQAAVDFLSIQGLASDSALRLVGKVRWVENKPGPKKYEHTPPAKQMVDDMINAINSTNDVLEISKKIDKILSESRVDFITKESMDIIDNKLKRQTTGKGFARYDGVIKREDLVEIKRPNQKNQEKQNEKDLNKEFNQIIEDKTGVKAESEFKDVKGRRAFDVKKRFRLANIFVPYTAEDLNGLMYALLPKGKKGDAAYKWIKENIYDPFSLATENISRARMAMMNDFEALKKELNTVPATLKEKVGKGFFTKEDAVRVWIWTRQGMEIPGLSKADAKELLNVVKNDKTLQEFATKLININKGDGYIKPDSVWDAGTITTDLLQNINEVKRSKYLEQWQNNVDTIFNDATKNKLRAIYGDKYVDSLNDILRRMKSGRNRLPGGNKQVDSWLDWLNNSVGAIMFLNIRSAVLQTISTVNYMNWSDNNPLKAAKAFANQKQFWSDFMMLFNSDYLVERRGGLKLNVQESEIADMAKKKGVKGVISYLLNKGFILTRMADSFAIANGGAAMYRNRVNTYLKEGKTQQEAETQAFQDFRELTEEAQQSSRPDRISMEQASSFGRVFLAFANTPMQYTRLMKRAAEDLAAKRGDTKTNISKLVYYGAVQNFIFNALQQALFALGFDDDEEEEKIKEKYTNTVNGMLDSILRGTGVVGNAVMVGKNFAMDVAKRSQKPKPNFQDAAWRLLDMSPPLDSKVTKIRSALYTLEYEGDKMLEGGVNLNNPAAMAGAQVISATTNVPMDRALRIYDNIRGAVAEDTETWQRIALLLGWSTWELGIKEDTELTVKGVKKKRKKKKRIKKR